MRITCSYRDTKNVWETPETEVFFGRAEEKWPIAQDAIKSSHVSETCRRYEISPTLFYRRKDEAEQGACAALGEKRSPTSGRKSNFFDLRPIDACRSH